jgi:hypothetical protein
MGNLHFRYPRLAANGGGETPGSRGASARFAAFLALCGEFIRDSLPARRRARYGDMDYDRDLRVDTPTGMLGWTDLLLRMLYSPYRPTDPQVFHEILMSLPIDHSQFIFVDLGSGRGRALLMPSDYPFRRILGVEVLPGLHRIAERNIRKYISPQQKGFEI